MIYHMAASISDFALYRITLVFLINGCFPLLRNLSSVKRTRFVKKICKVAYRKSKKIAVKFLHQISHEVLCSRHIYLWLRLSFSLRYYFFRLQFD